MQPTQRSIPRSLPTGPLLLRYRFDDQPQLLRHVHVLDNGRAALFYPCSPQRAPVGTKVLLEATFKSTGQSCLIRGSILARGIHHPGEAWIEFADRRVLRRVQDEPLSARRERRWGTSLFARLARGGASMMGHLSDVSRGGARVLGVSALRVGDRVDLALAVVRPDCPTRLGQGRVLRAADGEAALELDSESPFAREAARRFTALVASEWAAAPERVHPPGCCSDAGLLEPPIPRVKIQF